VAETATAVATAVAPAGGRVKASPVARRIAAELGVDLAAIAGSGPDGRIVKADVMAAANGSATRPAAPAATDGDGEGAKGAVEVIEPTRTQQLIARRMASAKATIPEFQVTVEVDAEAAFELREQLRGQTEPLPSVNDLVIKACALALRAHPGVNAAYVDGHFERYGRVNIGVAVAGPETLIVPTVFDADTKLLTEITAATRALAAKVRDGSVTPPELAGATFTVSNLGMLGVTRFTAVINPPQAAILAVGAANPRAVVGPDGSVSARRVMELTISADHRIVYGADAADFLATVRKRLERPAGLLL
jgi:pyruvate dehydrogenase E2 component (dihydrolipoamide acetyltransferase)